jgi:midasin (ATPase involved in ribosome maturation)
MLERLNAILDYRGEVLFAESNKTFQLREKTRIFAAQKSKTRWGPESSSPVFIGSLYKSSSKKIGKI